MNPFTHSPLFLEITWIKVSPGNHCESVYLCFVAREQFISDPFYSNITHSEQYSIVMMRTDLKTIILWMPNERNSYPLYFKHYSLWTIWHFYDEKWSQKNWQKERKFCMQCLLKEALTVANSWRSIFSQGDHIAECRCVSLGQVPFMKIKNLLLHSCQRSLVQVPSIATHPSNLPDWTNEWIAELLIEKKWYQHSWWTYIKYYQPCRRKIIHLVASIHLSFWVCESY